MDPITEKIRGGRPSEAQIRTLRLAAEEGSLCFLEGRWAPPTRCFRPLSRPYAQSGSVFALERRGLLAPDPECPRSNIPRTRVITELGRAYIRKLDAKLISALNRLWT